MDKNKQSDDMRRVIKDILGSSDRRPDVDVPDDYMPAESVPLKPRLDVEQHKIPKPAVAAAESGADVEMPVGYNVAGIGSSASPPKKKGGKMKGMLLVAAAVIIVGVLAAFLVVTNDNILGISLFGAEDTALPAGSTAVAAASQSGGNFSGGNVSAQAIEEERAKNVDLQEDINELTAEIERLKADGSDSNQESSLRVNQLERDNEQLKERIAAFNRDLAASQSELNVLRSAADESQGTSEKLQALDKEYRNVLASLQQAQEAGRGKDGTISELQGENSALRKRLTAAEQKLSAQESRTSEASVKTASVNTPVEKEPVPIRTIKPKYPETAKRRRVEGAVKVRVLISESGKVLRSKILSSPDPMGALDRAALEAVRDWKFQPGTRDGKASQMYYIVSLVFKL